MTYFMSAILGFVQGVAEFLPISSSGHLTLFQHFFGMEEPDQLFNVLLHFATLLAVCVVYWRDIWESFSPSSPTCFPTGATGATPRRPGGWCC